VDCRNGALAFVQLLLSDPIHPLEEGSGGCSWAGASEAPRNIEQERVKAAIRMVAQYRATQALLSMADGMSLNILK
jgi:hypothetical protein